VVRNWEMGFCSNQPVANETPVSTAGLHTASTTAYRVSKTLALWKLQDGAWLLGNTKYIYKHIRIFRRKRQGSSLRHYVTSGKSLSSIPEEFID
jgi:hypothetical protein